MNDSPMSYDMLRSIAVQVSQELYRQARVDAERAPRGPSCHDANCLGPHAVGRRQDSARRRVARLFRT